MLLLWIIFGIVWFVGAIFIANIYFETQYWETNPAKDWAYLVTILTGFVGTLYAIAQVIIIIFKT